MSNYKIINSRNIFIITLIVIPLTILLVWVLGLDNHRSLFANSLLSTTILSVSFFLFISIGLFNGTKIKNDLGVLEQENIFFRKNSIIEMDIPEIDDGFAGILFSLLLWFIISIAGSYLLWMFETAAWIILLNFIGILYWIFFRALRLVFKKSAVCKGNFLKSAAYGFGFTLLYNFWIYMIILMAHSIY
ncbi:hypothetical protein ACFFLS_07860 [Flavobacterium procerum]|uniref:Ubiquinone biosynthesis protein UbiA n=1 Tax=Flavobacterium procerum TaxID=1455569 RepID=A0ABV6BQN4_9FLAO